MFGDQRFLATSRTLTRSRASSYSTATPITNASAKSIAWSFAISIRASCCMPEMLP